jgi:hypothetical protein
LWTRAQRLSRRPPSEGMEELKIAAIFLIVCTVNPVCAAAQSTATENDAECAFVTEQAMAQRDQLRAPSAYATVSQPDTGLPLEAVFGASESVANLKKARVTMEVARTNCALYATTTDAQKKISFALPGISKTVLQHRLALIDQAVAKLDTMIAENMQRVAAQNMTRPAVYSLQSAKLRLIAERTATLTGITSPYVPPQPAEPLRRLVAAKQAADVENQRTLNRLQKQNSWDVALSVGAYRQLDSSSVAGTSPAGAYGAVSFTYNLGARSLHRHLDHSVNAYDKWQRAEFTDVVSQAEILRHEVADTIDIQNAQLSALSEQAGEIERNIRVLEGLDSDAAISFRNQLIADQAVLNVDIGDVTFRIDQLKDFLRTNY